MNVNVECTFDLLALLTKDNNVFFSPTQLL